MKIAVYTALFGDRDKLLTPLNHKIRKEIDWYVFTSHENISITPYRRVYKETKFKDLAKNARSFKILGDPLLESYDMVIWHDANIQLDVAKLDELISLANNTYLTTFKHPDRDDIYSEAMSCIRVGKDKPYLILKQMLVYFLMGMPVHSGLYATGILIKNNLYKDKALEDYWWKQVKKFSRRDQLALAYSVFKLKKKVTAIYSDILSNPYSIYHLHAYQEYKDKNGNIMDSWKISRKWSFWMVKGLRKIKKL